MSRGRWIAVVAAVVLLGVGAWQVSARGNAKEEEEKTAKAAKDKADQKVPDGVVAEGTVVPLQYTTLGFSMGGMVREVLVKEGDAVVKDQPLARLDTRELEARLQSARAEQARAAANLRQVRAGPRAEELAVREAQLSQARTEVDRNAADTARLEKLRERGVVPEQDVERARSALERARAAQTAAEADIKLMQAGARTEAVAVAEAGVTGARAAVGQVEAALQLAEIRAPFSGTVAWTELRPGEFVAPGAPAVRVADTSRWLIKTEDLTELAIIKVADRARVTLTFDALPGVELAGVVQTIRTFGERKKGDMTYTVTIEPLAQDPRLRWNMTASVRIAPAPDGGVTAGVDLQHLAR